MKYSVADLLREIGQVVNSGEIINICLELHIRMQPLAATVFKFHFICYAKEVNGA